MGLIMPLIYIVFFTETLMLIFKTKFEKVLPLTFIISAISLFLSGFLFKTFHIGFILCLLFSLLFPIHLIKNRKNTNIKSFITPGLLAFVIIYLIIFILDFNRFFTRWDELSHWGKMVKEMYKLNSFYSVNTSNLLVHKDYPPIMSLLELFYTYLCVGFKECYLIRCMHLFEASIIISVIPFKNNKKITYKLGIVVVFIYLLTLLFDRPLVINSIYTDYVMALLVAYVIYNIYKIKKISYFDIINISLSLIFLLLLKQVTIAFFLMIIFLGVVNLFIKKYEVNFKKLMLSFILIIVIPLSFMFSWRIYIKSMNIRGQFELSDIKVNEIKKIISADEKDNYQKKTLINYSEALFNKNILNSNLKVSYATFGLIILFIMYLIYTKYKGDINLKEYIPLCSTIVIGYIGYAVLMLLLYIFSFGIDEGPMLSSYERYMSTYILMCLYTFIFLIISYSGIKVDDNKKYIITIFIIAILIEPISYAKLRPDLILFKNHYFDIFNNSANLIDKYTNDMDKVFIIDQEEKEGSIFYINYFSNKVSTNLLNYELNTKIDNAYEYFYINYYDYLFKFDYLYTYSINNNLINKYSFLSSDKIEEHTLYKIIKNNDKINLIKIDSLK